jgi:hypothetical protein
MPALLLGLDALRSIRPPKLEQTEATLRVA